MQEEFIAYIWENRLFNSKNLQTTEGEQLEIINTGKKNCDSGPDFFNAQIKIGCTLWAGNIEIHHDRPHCKHGQSGAFELWRRQP